MTHLKSAKEELQYCSHCQMQTIHCDGEPAHCLQHEYISCRTLRLADEKDAEEVKTNEEAEGFNRKYHHFVIM
jgi:molybdenum cofactor biosynthesis enzyme MoaA